MHPLIGTNAYPPLCKTCQMQNITQPLVAKPALSAQCFARASQCLTCMQVCVRVTGGDSDVIQMSVTRHNHRASQSSSGRKMHSIRYSGGEISPSHELSGAADGLALPELSSRRDLWRLQPNCLMVLGLRSAQLLYFVVGVRLIPNGLISSAAPITIDLDSTREFCACDKLPPRKYDVVGIQREANRTELRGTQGCISWVLL
ncbi:hypothetical protein RRG08_027689 [Elysia crispata]|uniref:Uncharacterized protein n=1 Tax=Elysia crispata TaxID=231223 RepID=A0AAE0XM66_9GAST|nr:hypothetical protein RRG08_027689 [Elysia crispata]